MKQEVESFILKGNICYSKTKDEPVTIENGYIVCINGKCAGAFNKLPSEFSKLPVMDYSGKLIIPGMSDLHLHAPQYWFRSLGMDCELLDWLDRYAFPEESRYSDKEHVEKAYSVFVKHLRKSVTTRASVFATLHVEATLKLMDKLEKSGLKTYVGKVNMDRNCPEILTERTPEEAIKNTLDWLEKVEKRNYQYTKPIITPRFTPACSDKLMEGLGKISREKHIAVQSHLSENRKEIEFVKELCPWSDFYGNAYEKFGLFGGTGERTVMAHCVWSDEREVELMKKNNVFIAHCPQSNENICSGIAPVRKYLDKGMNIGLGSDIAGGYSLNMMRAVTDAVQVSKLRWTVNDSSLSPITIWESFYMATVGGGAFFGKVGKFEDDYEFDAVVLSDDNLGNSDSFNVKDRVERLLYLGDDRNVKHKFVAGRMLF